MFLDIWILDPQWLMLFEYGLAGGGSMLLGPDFESLKTRRHFRFALCFLSAAWEVSPQRPQLFLLRRLVLAATLPTMMVMDSYSSDKPQINPPFSKLPWVFIPAIDALTEVPMFAHSALHPHTLWETGHHSLPSCLVKGEPVPRGPSCRMLGKAYGETGGPTDVFLLSSRVSWLQDH